MAFGMLWNFKCVVTYGAGKWFLNCDDPFMAFGMLLNFECLVTYGASKWFHTCADPFMVLGMLWNFEWVAKNGAGKWILNCVDPFKIFQLVLYHTFLAFSLCHNTFTTSSPFRLSGPARPDGQKLVE